MDTPGSAQPVFRNLHDRCGVEPLGWPLDIPPEMTSEYTIVGLARRKEAVMRLQERLLGSSSNTVN